MTSEKETLEMRDRYGPTGVQALLEVEEALRICIDDAPRFARYLSQVATRCGAEATVAALQLTAQRVDDMQRLVEQTPQEALLRSGRSVATIRAISGIVMRATRLGLTVIRATKR